jgi:hypothetical protein
MEIFRAFDRVWLSVRLVGYGTLLALAALVALSA